MPTIASLMYNYGGFAQRALQGSPGQTASFCNLALSGLPAVHMQVQGVPALGLDTSEACVHLSNLRPTLDHASNLDTEAGVVVVPLDGVYQVGLGANLTAGVEGSTRGCFRIVDASNNVLTTCPVAASLISETMLSSASCLTPLTAGTRLRLEASNVVLLPDPPAFAHINLLTRI